MVLGALGLGVGRSGKTDCGGEHDRQEHETILHGISNSHPKRSETDDRHHGIGAECAGLD
jgi:hypothetical protein